MLLQKTHELGIDVRLQTKVEAIESSKVHNNNNIRFGVHASNTNDGEKYKIDADMVVHGAGRVPEIDDLDLEAASLERENNKGIKVNEYLQSVSNSAVYAAGDAAASEGLPLTPVATYEGVRDRNEQQKQRSVPTIDFRTKKDELTNRTSLIIIVLLRLLQECLNCLNCLKILYLLFYYPDRMAGIASKHLIEL
jgi:pyruvate/2-oxoglutarate dehydrogenase complex dihydrolipoamide dehydrogenase (E3) component